MRVIDWTTPADHFPWPHVQTYIDRIDSTVYHHAVEFAQEELLPAARPCPGCGTPAGELFWFSVTDPKPAWDRGDGRVGFLTVCTCCRRQVEFLIDAELTQMQADQWRRCRTLS